MPRNRTGQIAPFDHLVRHEFGTHVAFFPGPTRGEFHFRSVEDLAVVSGWPARGAAVDRTIVVALTSPRRAEEDLPRDVEDVPPQL